MKQESGCLCYFHQKTSLKCATPKKHRSLQVPPQLSVCKERTWASHRELVQGVSPYTANRLQHLVWSLLLRPKAPLWVRCSGMRSNHPEAEEISMSPLLKGLEDCNCTERWISSVSQAVWRGQWVLMELCQQKTTGCNYFCQREWGEEGNMGTDF